MKRIILKTSFILLLFSILCGCAREEFMDLYGFTERFTYSELSPEDFFIGEAEKNNYFYTCFDTENSAVILKLTPTENNKIGEVRIYLPKYDENANERPATTDDINIFIRIVSSSVQAFTGYDENISEDIINQMQLYEKKSYEYKGELTKTKDNFHFVYHSALLGSEFIIYNTYLKDVPETEKPESRPMYGDSTKIRTETVPTK